MANYIDQDGEVDFFDEDSVTLWVDVDGNFLGVGGVAGDVTLNQISRYNAADVFPTHTITVEEPSIDILPPDRQTVWNPGLNLVGGIPTRETIYTTLTPLGGTADDGPQIQAALEGCPAGQVVMLGPGVFRMNTNSKVIIWASNLTLRGSGAGVTILRKTEGAVLGVNSEGPYVGPIVRIGNKDAGDIAGFANVNLTADAVKGTYSVEVADASSFVVGQIVLLDELDNASFRADPVGRDPVWASPDYRVIWWMHDPPVSGEDSSATWSQYSRTSRVTNEWKVIASVSGSTVTFTTPIHWTSYRTAQTAQLTSFNFPVTTNTGVEHLTLDGGDEGNIVFDFTKYCWMKGVESVNWFNGGVNVRRSLGLEIRDSYIHDATWPTNGGAGYAIAIDWGSSECLVENCIVLKANKVSVARAAGAACVFGYNYMDRGGIADNPWVEMGVGGSHLVGPHHMLFEGNWCWNGDNDRTHGGCVYHTYFRNHLTGIRTAWTDHTGFVHDDATLGSGPARCAGAMAYCYYMSFIGNVLGTAGAMGSWVYEGGYPTPNKGIWLMGWDDQTPYPVDADVEATMIRDGNYDYLTNTQQWHTTPATYSLPSSLYLAGTPSFFESNPWPWVAPAAGATYVLPAKARYDAGFPNGLPPAEAGPAFQADAFQTDAFQVAAEAGEPAFQQNAFQNDAFQVEALVEEGEPAFQTDAFQNDAFQVEQEVVLDAAIYVAADTFFTATLTPDAVAVTMPFFVAADVFFTGTLTAGTRALTAALLADNDIFPVGTIALAGVQPIAMPFSGDSDVFFGATLTNLQKNLTAALYVEGDTFPSHTLTATYGLSAGLYGDADTFLAHSLTSARTLSGTLYADTDVFFSPLVGKDPEVMAGTLFGDEDEFPRHVMHVDIHYDFPIGRGMLADYGMRRMRTSRLVIGRR